MKEQVLCKLDNNHVGSVQQRKVGRIMEKTHQSAKPCCCILATLKRSLAIDYTSTVERATQHSLGVVTAKMLPLLLSMFLGRLMLAPSESACCQLFLPLRVNVCGRDEGGRRDCPFKNVCMYVCISLKVSGNNKN